MRRICGKSEIDQVSETGCRDRRWGWSLVLEAETKCCRLTRSKDDLAGFGLTVQRSGAVGDRYRRHGLSVVVSEHNPPGIAANGAFMCSRIEHHERISEHLSSPTSTELFHCHLQLTLNAGRDGRGRGLRQVTRHHLAREGRRYDRRDGDHSRDEAPTCFDPDHVGTIDRLRAVRTPPGQVATIRPPHTAYCWADD
jgi:hypothetical protein